MGDQNSLLELSAQVSKKLQKLLQKPISVLNFEILPLNI
jgi:hypothetical protein